MEVRLEELLGLTCPAEPPGHPGPAPQLAAEDYFQAIEDLQHNPKVIRLTETLRQARSQANHDAG